jgi:predicted dienelactone hydrolase
MRLNRLSKLLLVACLGAPIAALAADNRIDTIRSDAPTLAPYGAMSIGVTTLQLLNPNQFDIANARSGTAISTYDRPLTVEVWYPAALAPEKTGADQYRALTRDGKTEVTLYGKAVRDAPADARQGPYPLVIISHGYPGNRYLLSHLGENLASKGYVTVAIDHTDSTYDTQRAFASTLLNRPLDQLFVLNEMARLNTADPAGTLTGMVNADVTALIGYSMGGYGALNTIGAGFTAASVAALEGVPNQALAVRQAGNPVYEASIDPRIKAAMVFAPWGWNRGFWDAAGLAGIKTPVFFVAGSVDDIAGYSPGVRNLFDGSVNAPHFLLTFENANHNAGAPIPAPKETWAATPELKFIAAEHYADPVWDTTRMNNIAQHFATAFLGKYLKGDTAMPAYLKLVEYAKDGKWSVDASGTAKEDHSYWKGFPKRSAAGLRFEARGVN